jgi:hypothetical protein
MGSIELLTLFPATWISALPARPPSATLDTSHNRSEPRDLLSARNSAAMGSKETNRPS